MPVPVRACLGDQPDGWQEVNWETLALVASAVGGPVVGGYISLSSNHRGKHMDEVAVRSGVVTESRVETQAAFDRLYKFADMQEKDNDGLREDIRLCGARNDVLEDKVQTLTRELNRMYRRYGNGETPPAGTPTTST